VKPPTRVGIVARADMPERVKVAAEVASLLRGRVELVAKDELASPLSLPGEPLAQMRADVIVTIGGDGTILYTLQQNPAPVFGVNTGELGFLTEILPADLRAGLDRLLSGDFALEERTKVATRLNGERLPDATNEAVLKASRASKMLRLRIAHDRDLIDDALRADGVIVATPTGSTSYAMSAGGPIVDPPLPALILVPIAPFKLSSRPHVFPASDTLEIEMLAPGKDAVVVLDGQFERPIGEGDRLAFTGSEQKARFVRFRKHGFERVRKHLVR